MAAAAASTKQFAATTIDAGTRNQQGFTNLGLAAGAMGALIAGGFVVATRAAMDFESSFAGVRKTVDATESEFIALAQGMRGLAKEIPVNVNELNRIGESAGQLGVQKSAILGFTDTVAKMGVTTDLVGDQASNALARLHNIMQQSQDDFDRTGSTIVALGNAGASTESEIAEFGLRIAGAGKIAGLSLPNVLSIGNALASVGVEAEAGGTAVQKTLLSITDAVNTGGAKLDKFAATAGMSAEKFATEWRSNPIEAFTAFVEGLGASGQQAMGILKELGLTDQRLIRSFLSLAGAGDLLRTSVDLGTKAWDENVALQREAERRFGTTASKVQLAKNHLNDLAITVGDMVLPVLGFFAEKLSAVADLIGGLPGPFRAVVVVAGALAGAMLLVGAATLLIVPRIAATKAALASLNISFATTRAAAGSAAGFLAGPWGIALTVATIALGVFIAQKAAARQAINQYTDALKADTGAIGENTRALVAHRLEQSGALKAAHELGLELSTIVDAALGDAAAFREVSSALREVDGHKDAIFTLAAAVGHETEFVREGEAAYKREAEAVEGSTGAKKDAKGPTDALADATGDLALQAEDAATAAERLEETITALIGIPIDAERAMLDWKDALHSVTQAFKENGPTLDANTVKGRANRNEIVQGIDAARRHAEAIANQSGSVEKGSKVLIDHVAQLREVMRAEGLSEDAIDDYIRALKLTPKEIRTEIRLAAQEAEEDLARVRAMIAAIPNTKTVKVHVERTEGGHVMAPQARASGGPVSAFAPYLVGERGTELFVPDSAGRIVPHNQLAPPARVQSVASGGDGASLVGVTVTGTLDTPWGPAKIRGVVRDEIAADAHHQSFAPKRSPRSRVDA